MQPMMNRFGRYSIDAREATYLKMAADIWDPDAIKELAGGWDDEEKKDFFKSEKAEEYTVEYAGRSWPDALKYGFLSANSDGSGKQIHNVQVGDIVYCHVAGVGFLGIGECVGSAVPMAKFSVTYDSGAVQPIGEVQWSRSDLLKQLIPEEEVFIRVDWKRYVEDERDGYWEKGMKSIPLVAYRLNDKTTYEMVRRHFEEM